MGLASSGSSSGETKIAHTAVQDMQLIVQETPGAPPMSSGGGGGGYGYGGSGGGSGGYGSRTAVTSSVASSNLLDKYTGSSGFDSGGSGGIVEDQYGIRFEQRSNSPAYRSGSGSSCFGASSNLNSSADRDIASLTVGASAKSDYSYDRPRGMLVIYCLRLSAYVLSLFEAMSRS